MPNFPNAIIGFVLVFLIAVKCPPLEGNNFMINSTDPSRLASVMVTCKAGYMSMSTHMTPFVVTCSDVGQWTPPGTQCEGTSMTVVNRI